jgi:hypothetical protein
VEKVLLDGESFRDGHRLGMLPVSKTIRDGLGCDGGCGFGGFRRQALKEGRRPQVARFSQLPALRVPVIVIVEAFLAAYVGGRVVGDGFDLLALRL